jgi:hypothetical protein
MCEQDLFRKSEPALFAGRALTRKRAAQKVATPVTSCVVDAPVKAQLLSFA